MLDRFKKHLSDNFKFLRNRQLLLAVSGGVDSMVMAWLFEHLGYDVSVAHCDFNLRGNESTAERKFVERHFNNRGIPVHTTIFDTRSFAKENDLSIQMAARQLRYFWFQELVEDYDFDYVLTAHHADDSLETFFINLSRGTGIDGLTGIPMQQDVFIRPLLPFTREEIETFAREKDIFWMEDSSNASDDYLRNKIRHHVVPVLKEGNPSFMESFADTVSHLSMAQSMVNDAISMVSSHVVVSTDTKTLIKLDELLELKNYQAYLFYWLKDLGFKAWSDIYQLPYAQTGKKVYSDNYMILKDRHTLVVSEIPEDIDDEFLVERSGANQSPVELLITSATELDEVSPQCIFVDADQLKFPLSLRKWRKEDYFYPFGLGGKKLVSKYFKDEKFSLHDKADAWILCSEDDIVWIVGHRADDRFKVTPQTKNILKIKTST